MTHRVCEFTTASRRHQTGVAVMAEPLQQLLQLQIVTPLVRFAKTAPNILY
jgi:hypothetical protein